MLHIPSVDDWWQLTGRFPEFRHVSTAALKEYAYMMLLAYVQDHPLERVLEFGHGFAPLLLSRIQNSHETWGVDNWQGLHYFPPREQWLEEYKKQVVDLCPAARLHLGLLDTPSTDAIPTDYFDLVCSVSVLEELPIEKVTGILRHGYRLLRSGGVMMNSIDLCIGKRYLTAEEWYRAYFQAHIDAGFELAPEPCSFDFTTVLVENPTMCMAVYQGDEAESRKYFGHWTTLIIAAKKP